ncbi:unnamed protein product [Paramecium octaurelia]|uniref:Uncharacterized protein n=1 Tax=Paramecium octaurelia TaxID=43137 RepID=A0A8S1WHX9_PAROT|nr:unnamed protein product [Paramecium octaurelia]
MTNSTFCAQPSHCHQSRNQTQFNEMVLENLFLHQFKFPMFQRLWENFLFGRRDLLIQSYRVEISWMKLFGFQPIVARSE